LKHRILIDPLLELESYSQILESVKSITKKTALATGVMDGQKCHLAYALAAHSNRPIVYIAENPIKAGEIFRDISFFEPTAMLYPARDILSYYATSSSTDILKERLRAINALLEGRCRALIIPIEALLDLHIPKERFSDFIMDYSVGDVVDMEELLVKLVNMGYERADAIEGAGQFARRGGILDIFGALDESPLRLEFWGDELDSIRIFDAHSQRSVDKTDICRIFPMSELVYNQTELASATSKIQVEYENSLKKLKDKGLRNEAAALRDNIGRDLERLCQNSRVSGMKKYAGYFHKCTSLFEYLPKDTILFFDEPTRIAQQANSAHEEFIRMMQARLEKGLILPNQVKLWQEYADILHSSEKFSVILLSTLPRTLKDFAPEILAHFEIKSQSSTHQRLDLLKEDLDYHLRQNYAICVLSGTTSRAQRLHRELSDDGFSAVLLENLEDVYLEKGKIALVKGAISRGFDYPRIGLFVISGSEFFQDERKRKKTPRKKRQKGAKIDSFTDLNVGDYVVHDNHGIGVYCGIEKIEIDNISRDYLKIGYHGGSALFVAISQLDALQKYIGGENARPKIHRLGGSEWQKTKSRVRGAVEIMAKELLNLYAKREAAKGYKYSQDTAWQQEFEEDFAYEETQDQLLAIEDVKKDMESVQVMDRLICGDVGYGKTEVAIRAAFKAVNDQKQVAVLVPTTILAQQHYTTFCERMKNFPINVHVLSRFKTPKAQRQTLAKLTTGEVDIIIGTHRLLSKDVVFKDLGLIVVDEEQRFGVGHKEKLKHLRESVDVLTLTATPIPRTLHMSLSGIRDMSLLEEPPQERQPIATYVLEYSEQLIRDAIVRELSRGGQVYYLHNRVSNISKTAGRIAEMVPEANVAFAHGQMSEDELENVMMDFIEGEIDVLVCTTIVESGLDIPNVNTIIIQDADYLGLSQLYQLRGRVGRSNRTSFAYLTYKKDKILTEIAEKRLSTIREFTEFGAGFKIAMRDLEIRGAGNLLGSSQHGHMDNVGYEMYCRLLDEAVKGLRGVEIKEDFETLIDINIDAYIPDTYISNELQKLEIYKRISHILSEKDLWDVQEEMEDRYGDLPRSASNLLDIALLKAYAHAIDVVSIIQRDRKLVVSFKADAKADAVRIADTVAKSKGKLFFTIGANPYITFKLPDEYGDFGFIKELIGFIKRIGG